MAKKKRLVRLPEYKNPTPSRQGKQKVMDAPSWNNLSPGARRGWILRDAQQIIGDLEEDFLELKKKLSHVEQVMNALYKALGSNQDFNMWESVTDDEDENSKGPCTLQKTEEADEEEPFEKSEKRKRRKLFYHDNK